MTEQVDDKLLEQEHDAIEKMIRKASKAGLLIEVVWSFSAEIRSGFSVEEAAMHALYDWDC